MNVYVTRRIPQENLDLLGSRHQVEVNPHDRALTRDELLAAVRGRDAVITLLTDRVDGELLDAAGPQCRIFANFAVGYDNFDVEAALADARAINPSIEVIKMSAWKGDGLQAWFDWLLARMAATKRT